MRLAEFFGVPTESFGTAVGIAVVRHDYIHGDERRLFVVVPGVGFGQAGEGYFRLALTVTTARIQEALERIRRVIR